MTPPLFNGPGFSSPLGEGPLGGTQPPGALPLWGVEHRAMSCADGGNGECRAQGSSGPEGGAGGLAGRRVLIVEDQVLIATALKADLQDFGLAVTGIAGNVAAALDLIGRDPPDLAVLDLNLGRENSIPVAEVLGQGGIPFVFTTGDDSDLRLPPFAARVPVVGKPYLIGDILSGLMAARDLV